MRAGRKIIEGKGLDKFISGEISKFKFDVGILQNKPHFEVLKRKIGTKTESQFMQSRGTNTPA